MFYFFKKMIVGSYNYKNLKTNLPQNITSETFQSEDQMLLAAHVVTPRLIHRGGWGSQTAQLREINYMLLGTSPHGSCGQTAPMSQREEFIHPQPKPVTGRILPKGSQAEAHYPRREYI